MIFSFVVYYLLGAIVFFSHMSLTAIHSTLGLRTEMSLSDIEAEQLFLDYFPKILFQTIMMIVFPIAFAIYVKVNEYYYKTTVVSSGLFTIFWLILTGAMIKGGFYFLTEHVHSIKAFNCGKNLKDREFFWIVCPLLFGILFSFYNHTVFFTILALVLGKYIWMDLFEFFLVRGIKRRILKRLNTYKRSFFLIICQLFVLGYLMIRWYPIRNKAILSGDIINIFLVLGVFLFPVFDLLLYESMKSLSREIIKSR